MCWGLIVQKIIRKVQYINVFNAAEEITMYFHFSNEPWLIVIITAPGVPMAYVVLF